MSSGRTFKVVLLGDATVGKTHLVSRFTRGTLPDSPKATIGVEFHTSEVAVAPDVRVRAQIWDTAGQEKFKSVTVAHYRRAFGALIVYDVTQMQSFVNTSRWAEELKQNAEPDVVVVLVGNKVDLADADPGCRQVQANQAEEFAKKHGFLFFETSAVSGKNVNECFTAMMKRIHEVTSKNTQQIMDRGGPGVNWGGANRSDRKFVEIYNNEFRGGLKLGPNQQNKQKGKCCGDEE